MQKVILLIDDDIEFLDLQAELLQDEGYETICVATVEEARVVMSNRVVHVALCDIRLVDDKEPEDVHGLILAQEDQFRDIPKIILSNYINDVNVHELIRTLEQPAGKKPAALRVLSKTDDPSDLLKVIDEIFEEHVRINWELLIRWESIFFRSFAQLVLSVLSALDNTVFEQAKELKDLFNKLFADQKQITICEPIGGGEGLGSSATFCLR